MSGFQEILIIVFILIGVLYLPRRNPGKSDDCVKRSWDISGRMRLAIVVSVLWPLAVWLMMPSRQGNPLLFVGVGLLPVAAGWAAAWVVGGYRQRR